MALRSVVEEREPAYVSTGHLPDAETVQSLVNEAQRRFQSNRDGTNSQVYPALARVPSALFGVCVVGTRGLVCGAGEVDYEFSIMSVSKPFLFALVCETIGPEQARAKLEANATGFPFNIEQGGGRTNPMVNAGAIATTSLAPGANAEARWKLIHDGLWRFAGRKVPSNEEVYASASQTNFRNRSIARQVVLGILYIAFGIILVSQPLTGALLLTYVLGLALLISGVVRMLIGVGRWQQGGAIMLASGLFGVLAGLVILTGLPMTGLWVLGLLLGIDLLSHGIVWLPLAWRPAAAAA